MTASTSLNSNIFHLRHRLTGTDLTCDLFNREPSHSWRLNEHQDTNWKIIPLGSQRDKVTVYLQCQENANPNDPCSLSVHERDKNVCMIKSVSELSQWVIKRYPDRSNSQDRRSIRFTNILGLQTFTITSNREGRLLTALQSINRDISVALDRPDTIDASSLWYIYQGKRRQYTIRNVKFGTLLSGRPFCVQMTADRISKLMKVSSPSSRNSSSHSSDPVAPFWRLIPTILKIKLPEMELEIHGENGHLKKKDDPSTYLLIKDGKLMSYKSEQQDVNEQKNDLEWEIVRLEIEGVDFGVNLFNTIGTGARQQSAERVRMLPNESIAAPRLPMRTLILEEDVSFLERRDQNKTKQIEDLSQSLSELREDVQHLKGSTKRPSPETSVASSSSSARVKRNRYN